MKAFHRRNAKAEDDAASVDHDYRIEPLRSFVLTMDQVRALRAGSLKYLDTLSPQVYERVERLHPTHEYINPGPAWDKDDDVGYFYHMDNPEERDFAGTGSGCDVWFVVREGLVDAFRQCEYPSNDDRFLVR
jgi:hypothetical protein